MAASDRRQIQEQLKQPDPFFEAIEEARDYFEHNRSTVLGVGGAALALFALIYGGTSYWRDQGNKAAADFASAISNLEFNSPAAAEASLKNLSQRSNAGPYKALATLYRANIASDAGRAEEAIVAYDQFLTEAPTPYLKQVGLMGKAAALEKAGKQPEASAALEQAAGLAGPYRRTALRDRARLAAAAGDKAAALAALEKLLALEGSGCDSAENKQQNTAHKPLAPSSRAAEAAPAPRPRRA